MKNFKKIALALILSGAVSAHALPVSPTRAPLVVGTTYTISIGVPNPDHVAAVATPLSTVYGTTTAQAQANAADPANPTLNFQFPPDTFAACTKPLLLVVQDPANTLVRQDIVPCPTSTTTQTPIGVTPRTTTQAETNLLAGTDPITTVFTDLVVRNNLADSELTIVGTALKHGIYNPGGFIDYLMTTRGVTQAQIDAYNSNLNAKLADPNSGYNVLMNASANAVTNSVEDTTDRGKAAALLLQMLLDAANDPNTKALPTDISRDYIIEAIDSMGIIVIPELIAANAAVPQTLSNAALSSLESTVGTAIQKLKANRVIANYSDAMLTLGAGAADVTQFQGAANTLVAAMDTAFAAFENSAFNNVDPNAEGDPVAIGAAQTQLGTDLGTAFAAFQAAMAASNARMTAMIAKMCPSNVGCPTLADLQVPAYDASGNPVVVGGVPQMQNWPINKVVLTDAISGVLGAGGSFAYARAADAIPDSVIPWVGNCVAGAVVIPGVPDRATCAAAPNNGTWVRTDFKSAAFAGLSASEAAQMGIGEDIQILGGIRDTAYMASFMAIPPLNQQQMMTAGFNAEKAFTDGVARLAASLTGTTDGTAAITAAQQSAAVTLMQDPRL